MNGSDIDRVDGLSIAIVGPSHPYSGGIAQHTSSLANRLEARGALVRVVSWKAQYPKFLRDGDTTIPEDEPEVVPPSDQIAPLTWYNPVGWYRWGRRLRAHDLVILNSVTPFHAVPFLVFCWGLGRSTSVAAVTHNVVPQSGGTRFHLALNRAFFGRLDGIMTHSDSQHEIARRLAPPSTSVVVAPIPLPDLMVFPTRDSRAATSDLSAAHGNPLRVLFFGMIRDYKGLDVLIEALPHSPSTHLTVVGEFWEPEDRYRSLATTLGVNDRVTWHSGYLPAARIPAFFAESDVLALPYRGGSASFHVSLTRRFGLPVVATSIGTFPRDIRDGEDGFIVPPEDPAAFGEALEKLADSDVYRDMREAVTFDDGETDWARYLDEILAFGASESP